MTVLDIADRRDGLPTGDHDTDVFDTTDLDAAHAMLAGLYGSMRLSATGDHHRLRIERHSLGRLDLHRNCFDMTFEAEGPPPDLLAVGQVRRGVLAHLYPRLPAQVGAGDVFLAGLPGVPYRSVVHAFEVDVVLIKADVLNEIADGGPGRFPQPIRFLDRRPVSPSAGALLSSMYAHLWPMLTQHRRAALAPLLAGNVVRLFAAHLLSTFPNTAVREPVAADRRDAHPATLRRAMAYIEENAHRDICVTEIAAAANVTVRALQLAFRRHLDITPMVHLRRVRLDRAHQDLISADPSSATVSGIAATWGFLNHSRFTAHYRSVYGLPPSVTLRGL